MVTVVFLAADFLAAAFFAAGFLAAADLAAGFFFAAAAGLLSAFGTASAGVVFCVADFFFAAGFVAVTATFSAADLVAAGFATVAVGTAVLRPVGVLGERGEHARGGDDDHGDGRRSFPAKFCHSDL